VVQNHHATPAIAAKKSATPTTIERFTFVVRLWTSISGNPELSFSMDMVAFPMDRRFRSWCPSAPSPPCRRGIQGQNYFRRGEGGIAPKWNPS
jgi:hypothetical protein